MSIESTVQLEKRVAELEALVAKLMEAVPEASMDDECRKRECSYFSHYLLAGGPDLTHEQYHRTEVAEAQHSDECTRWQEGYTCAICLGFERSLRA